MTKAYTPSTVKFDATTTTREHFPGHAVSPEPRLMPKPYNATPVKFEGSTTTAEHFPAHHVGPPKPLVTKAYTPSTVKFDATTTNKDTFVAHQLPEIRQFRPAANPGHLPLRLEATTTTGSTFIDHGVQPTPLPTHTVYKPSTIPFDATTTMKDAFKGHDVQKRPPIGLAVADDGFQVMIDAGADLPARATKVFTTTETGQTVVAVRMLQGWSRRASENEPLGVFMIRGIPPAPAGSPQILMTLQLDKHGRLHVEGRDMETGQHGEWHQADGDVSLTDDGEKQ